MTDAYNQARTLEVPPQALPSPTALTLSQFHAKKDLLIRTVCPGLNDDEFELFAMVARRTGLDPFSRQVYALKVKGRMTTYTSIDGYRLIAQRTGDYQGQTAPEWCGENGVWRDVWLGSRHPEAARIGVHRRGFTAPLYAVATYRSYSQEKSDTWRRMPDVMLSKCAEALALRKAFPAELSGVYTADEMDQAQEDPEPTKEIPLVYTAQQQADFQQAVHLFQTADTSTKWEYAVKIAQLCPPGMQATLRQAGNLARAAIEQKRVDAEAAPQQRRAQENLQAHRDRKQGPEEEAQWQGYAEEAPPPSDDGNDDDVPY